jgi:hypothetical protein
MFWKPVYMPEIYLIENLLSSVLGGLDKSDAYKDCRFVKPLQLDGSVPEISVEFINLKEIQ